ncbi:MAG TPA: HEPN domain-containing protein [Nitrospirae bacterium]|nr:HEPN domain-containing protein [Nitrospirota bacterium]HDZ00003.1 HEPN domain-containing protein [Nitrospirota bacterium]
MKKATTNWLLSMEYDLKTAASLLKNKRYIYVVFMCHLAIEKALKAILSEMHKELPPYTHNINRLIELGTISLPDTYQVFIDKINLQSVPTRYPEDFQKISKEFNKKIAEDYLKQTRGIIRWLKQNIPQLKSKK